MMIPFNDWEILTEVKREPVTTLTLTVCWVESSQMKNLNIFSAIKSTLFQPMGAIDFNVQPLGKLS